MKSDLKTVLEEKAQLLSKTSGGLISVTPDTRVSDVVHTMCEANIGCVLVIEEDRLVGIFSERDALHRLCNRKADPDAMRVRDVMTREVITVKPSITVEDALTECTVRRVRHLPVVEDGQLVGLLSIGDLVRYVIRDKESTIADLTSYIQGTS